MVKGYTDWINMVCKSAEPVYQEALKAIPIDAIPLDELKSESEQLAIMVATNLSMAYDNFRL